MESRRYFLGREIFETTVVDMDFPRRRLEFRRQGRINAEGSAQLLPLQPNAYGSRHFPVSVNGRQSAEAISDLGSNAPPVMSSAYAEHAGLLIGRRVATSASVGVEGPIINRVTTLDYLTIGDIRIEHMPVLIPPVWNRGSTVSPRTRHRGGATRDAPQSLALGRVAPESRWCTGRRRQRADVARRWAKVVDRPFETEPRVRLGIGRRLEFDIHAENADASSLGHGLLARPHPQEGVVLVRRLLDHGPLLPLQPVNDFQPGHARRVRLHVDAHGIDGREGEQHDVAAVRKVELRSARQHRLAVLPCRDRDGPGLAIACATRQQKPKRGASDESAFAIDGRSEGAGSHGFLWRDYGLQLGGGGDIAKPDAEAVDPAVGWPGPAGRKLRPGIRVGLAFFSHAFGREPRANAASSPARVSGRNRVSASHVDGGGPGASNRFRRAR